MKFILFILFTFVTLSIAEVPETAVESEINPELTRELLLTAVRLLERDANLKSRRGESNALERLPPVIPPLKPCKLEGDDEAPKGKGRRSIGIATNPYTGQLHYVAYPNYYYPTVYG